MAVGPRAGHPSGLPTAGITPPSTPAGKAQSRHKRFGGQMMLTVDARREALDAVEAHFPKLPYMQRRWANKVTELIERHDLIRCLELGCFQGKSTAFIAATLRALGRG